jgi:hypothetical protein
VARDYYAEATTIADGAARVGLGDLSERLRQAIEEGFTSSDILMRIRSVLIDSGTELSVYPDLATRSQSLINGIDEALR